MLRFSAAVFRKKRRLAIFGTVLGFRRVCDFRVCDAPERPAEKGGNEGSKRTMPTAPSSGIGRTFPWQCGAHRLHNSKLIS